jgi:glycosyltransferase involved in cell wall biosynthesis
MKVMHFHFGKDGGAERFFTHLVNAFARRDIEQISVIRPDRAWRPDIAGVSRIVESHFRNLSLDRVLLPMKVMRMAKAERPDAIMAWAPRASELMPAYDGCIKISRLGDYPLRLSYFRNTDVIVCNTPGIADQVRKLGWDRRVEVISNFTNTEKVAPIDRAAFDTPAGVPLVMSMGRFVRRKGFHTLIDAVARLPDTWLWLAGEGEEREALEAQARERGVLDRTRFLGWLQDARPHVAAADIFVMPSNHEPLGNVILEAWAQGRPVVSSRSEGPLWFMRDGENGLLCDIDDDGGLAAAIAGIQSDAQLARSLAEGGHRTLMAQFSEEAIAGAYIDLFRSRGR